MLSNTIKLHLHPISTGSIRPGFTGKWRMGAVMAAVALLTSVASMEANALALGRITVQSALGEPLRAEIDITEINAAEASTLRATVASPESFKAAGVEFMPVLNGIQINLQRRPDGRSFLRLTGSNPVTEPFVDLILDANWASGRVARDYTMLFDPPGMRSNTATAPSAPIAPVISRQAPVSPAPQRFEPAPAVAASPRAPSAPAYSPPQPAPRPLAIAKPPAAPKATVAKLAPTETNVTVRPGDTAGRIAAQNKMPSVSLDQMLVALLRGNPEAFIGGNINRVKSGAVLEIPSAQAVAAISPTEATQTISAQSADFNAFRRKLASGVQATPVASADRQASGKVQAKVEDRAPSSAVPDKLTLSKGAVGGKLSADEQKIAAERQARESSTRVAELSKNISDLNKLGAASAAASANAAPVITLPTPPIAGAPSVAAIPAQSAPSSSPASGAPTTAPSAMASSAAAAASAATASAVASASTGSASSPAASPASSTAPVEAASAAMAAASTASATPGTSAASAPVIPATSPAPAEPGLTDELLDNPLLMPGLALLIALLGGYAFYRYRQSREPAQIDSSFLESRLQPDSFFGASGGQRVDTSESNVTGSSLVYSPSQLDAAGDVDPVAEADVYLAYGRDLQAEEILKEAMRTTPMRVAIHAKLMEIYAKRRDTKAFSMIATDAFKLTGGEGPDWAYIAEMGREADPSNPLYQPGGQPQPRSLDLGAAAGSIAVANSGGFGSSTLPQAIEPQFTEASGPVDFDLDLDFSMDEASVPKTASAPVASFAQAPEVAKPVAAATPEPMFDEMIMDFGDSAASFTPPPSATVQAAPGKEEPLSFESISFTDEAFSADPSPTLAPTPAPAVNSAMVEFDMGNLSLDLNEPVTESTPISGSAPLEEPLETKFALAEEFRSLGDPDGARALAEEVLLEATGPLKVKAQAFLNALT